MATSFATQLLRARGRSLGAPAAGAFDVEVKLTASPDLLNRLSTLPDKLQKKGARKAARKAMNIVRDNARAAARDLDDEKSRTTIWRNIVTQESSRQGRRIGGIVMRVGVMGGAQYSEARAQKAESNPGGYTWYWRFLELKTRRTAAQEFLQPALRNNLVFVEGFLAEYLEREIELLTPKT